MIDFLSKSAYDVDDFRQLIHFLRRPEGCPWDSVQTHKSIRDNFLEETYEACEAIDTDNTDLLREELGDVLMQVIFHASIEEDAGHFTLDDVADTACKKLIFRHPNLFGGHSGASWEELKQQEKGFSTQTERLDAVARSLPALWRARKIQRRAAESGFRFSDTAAPLSKVEEEWGELRQAVESNTNMEEELGDLLFAVVSLARQLDIDPEKALHKASDKFIHRFGRVEALADKPLTQLTEADYRALWQQAKAFDCSE